MESNKLTTLEKNLPLRVYSDELLNKALLMDFMPYISKLLSLTDKSSADKLEIALPAIKRECIGMGFVEIKKMFDLYASGKLEIQPISNYFDTILFGKIINSYRQQKPKKTVVKIEDKKTDEENEFIMLEAVDRIKKEVDQNGKIDSICVHVYDFLYKQGKLPKHTSEFKAKIREKAIKIAKSEAMTRASESYSSHLNLKKTLENINKNSEVIKISKKLVLEEYFKK